MRLSAAVLAATLVATAAEAREVVFPLVVDHALLRASLARQLGEEADGSALVWGTRGGCRSLVLRDLRVGRAARARRRLAAPPARSRLAPLRRGLAAHHGGEPAVGRGEGPPRE